jgi:hypothetical protein
MANEKLQRHKSAGIDQIPAKLINPLKDELNPICHLLGLLGAHHILHISRIRVKIANTNKCEYLLYNPTHALCSTFVFKSETKCMSWII